METNKKLKELSDRLVAVMGEMDTLRRELSDINAELQVLCPDVESSEADGDDEHEQVFVGIASMPTFTPLYSDTEAADVQERASSPKKRLIDSISVIDLFRFRRELFGDDAEEMARVFGELEEMKTQSEAIAYISGLLNMDTSQDTVSDLLRVTASYYANND